ncbi:Methyltransferase domain-containing protein [Amycolatopsis xylanica]|uniref:Methyltransferase domain-containing protein n=1 Tax=Amycolatopsis xylanica TaxID=589385 RepID=A0A1H2Z2A4_9PSEU|nr:class I SAM-dependent methyltransferase [Amycolatopsis xylanica]SDX11496.1 Methyltransferase domain-containing protein [Amycolatopsis xylanica]
MGNESTPISHELRAKRATSFGGAAAAYAAHRPDYPIAAVRWGLSGAAKAPVNVLDLAAGTGKLTTTLVEQGLTVTAVEPDEQMLAQLRHALPGITALDGHAERIPLETASVDAVFVGQAFHWFDAEPALTEISRVLRPGGVLVTLWNYDDLSVPWVAEFGELFGAPTGRTWAASAARLPDHPNFAPSEQETFRHKQRRTAESLVATLATHSHVLAAASEERAAILRTAQEFLAGRPETASGEFDRPIVVTGFRARRR